MRQPVRISEVTRYKAGTNELLDKILTGPVPFIVQGSKGRRPIIAENEDEARDRYKAIDVPVLEDEVTDEAL